MKKYFLLCIIAFICVAQITFAQSQVYTPFAFKRVQPPLPVKPASMVSSSLNPVYVADKDPLVALMNNTQDIIKRSRANCLPRKYPDETIVLNAERINNFTAALKWETKYAFKASGFDVERSFADTFHFVAVNFAAATTGKNIKRNYQLPDNNDYTDISFYRIRQRNTDTGYQYSNIVAVKGNESQPFRVYPNPAKEKVWIEVTPKQTGNATIMLYDVTGKVLQQQLMSCTKNILAQKSLIVSKLAAGFYQVKILMPDKTFLTGKFVKQ